MKSITPLRSGNTPDEEAPLRKSRLKRATRFAEEVRTDKIEAVDCQGSLGDVRKEWASVGLLVALYFVQGMPIGLVFGTLPFLMQQRGFSYAEISIVSLSSWPYSLKIMWSPIVDGHYSQTVGRRRSWILPTQVLIAVVLFATSEWVEAALNGASKASVMAAVFFVMVLLAATQDIAVDGWAVTMLPPRLKSYASTCQSVGLTAGYFSSFTVFLALNSAEFCNRYVFAEPHDAPLLGLTTYMRLCALVYLLVTLLVLLRTEGEAADDAGPVDMYQRMVAVFRLRPVHKLAVALALNRLGPIAAEVLTVFALMERGLRREDMALLVLVDFPLQIAVATLAGYLAAAAHPLRTWLWAHALRLVMAFVLAGLVAAFPTGEVTIGFLVLISLANMTRSLVSTVQFVAMGAYFVKISDDTIGGSYMTLLNVLANFSGTWPTAIVFWATEALTVRVCHAPDRATDLCVASCAANLRSECLDCGGSCSTESHGYFPVALGCASLGVLLLPLLARQVRRLEAIPNDDWRVSRKS